MRFPDWENALFDQLIMHCELYIKHYFFSLHLNYQVFADAPELVGFNNQ